MTSANDGSVASGTAPTATAPDAPPPPPDAPPPPPGAPAPPGAALPPPEATAAAEDLEDQTPFWMPWHPRWPAFPTRPPRHPPPRRPVLGVGALVVFGLVSTFFAWVSAEPMWLAMGHGDRGVATATRCSVEGSAYQCVIFTAAGSRYVAEDVKLLGTEHGHLRQGTPVAAAMVSPRSSRAYAVDAVGLRLRSAAGLVVLLLCGLGIAWATGATRIDPPGSRRAALLTCLGGPLLLTLGFLAATW